MAFSTALPTSSMLQPLGIFERLDQARHSHSEDRILEMCPVDHGFCCLRFPFQWSEPVSPSGSRSKSLLLFSFLSARAFTGQEREGGEKWSDPTGFKSELLPAYWRHG